MADVDRGQLILVTALLIGAAFVALALLLNTVIYTENLASRGSGIGEREAIAIRDATNDSAADLLAAENGADHATNESIRTAVNASLDDYETVMAERWAPRGAAVSLSNRTLYNGSRLEQNDTTRNMTAADAAINWTLVRGVRDLRGFVVEITDETALNRSSDPVNETDRFFRVVVADGTDEWRLYVYRNTSGATTETELAVRNGSASDPSVDICPAAVSTTPRIDLTNGSVDGKPCGALDFAKGLSPPYDVEYVFSNRTQGTYSLAVNLSEEGSVASTNFADPGNGQPFEASIVYALRLDVRFVTDALRYRARLRVTPGDVG